MNNPFGTDMCRISMKEPKVLCYEYETLILTDDEKDKLVEILNTEFLWDKLKSFVNDNSVFDDNDTFNAYFEFDYSWELPDYSKINYDAWMSVIMLRNRALIDQDLVYRQLYYATDISIHTNLLLIYTNKNYELYYRADSDSFFIKDIKNNKVYDDIDYDTQLYSNKSNADNNELHISRNILNEEVRSTLYARLNVIEQLSLIRSYGKELLFSQIDVPIIKV